MNFKVSSYILDTISLIDTSTFIFSISVAGNLHLTASITEQNFVLTSVKSNPQFLCDYIFGFYKVTATRPSGFFPVTF